MGLLSATWPPPPSSPTSVLNPSRCPAPRSLLLPGPGLPREMEFSTDGSKCRGIYFRSLISICRAVISWASTGPRAPSLLRGAAWRSTEFWGSPGRPRRAQPGAAWKAASIRAPGLSKWENIFKPQAASELNIYSFRASPSVHGESRLN